MGISECQHEWEKASANSIMCRVCAEIRNLHPKEPSVPGMIHLEGMLQIDTDRGVIYFHTTEGHTALRICRLPTPIPETSPGNMLDITHMTGANW